jgi:hypothetical protein
MSHIAITVATLMTILTIVVTIVIGVGPRTTDQLRSLFQSRS